jgi:hypothetical protein
MEPNKSTMATDQGDDDETPPPGDPGSSVERKSVHGQVAGFPSGSLAAGDTSSLHALSIEFSTNEVKIVIHRK